MARMTKCKICGGGCLWRSWSVCDDCLEGSMQRFPLPPIDLEVKDPQRDRKIFDAFTERAIYWLSPYERARRIAKKSKRQAARTTMDLMGYRSVVQARNTMGSHPYPVTVLGMPGGCRRTNTMGPDVHRGNWSFRPSNGGLRYWDTDRTLDNRRW